MSIKLFIIATPIGNLKDLSERSKDILADVDLIFAEDTRVSIKLLHHLGLKKKLVSCHKFNEKARIAELERAFERGENIALMSDAGTPLVSDPGQSLVIAAIEIGFEICAIPGPTAFVQALIGSGLPCDRFSFYGFLPDKRKHLVRFLEELKDDNKTLVFYVSPHGLEKKLSIIEEILGDRKACLARELTKMHEEYIRATLNTLPDSLSEENLRGEFTLVIEGSNQEKTNLVDEKELKRFILGEHGNGSSVNEIAKACQKQFGVKKSDAYKLALDVIEDR